MHRIRIMTLVCAISTPLYIFSAMVPSTAASSALGNIALTIDWNQVSILEDKANLLVDQTVAKFSHEGKHILTKTACGGAVLLGLGFGNKCYDEIVKYYHHSPKKIDRKNRHWWFGIRWGALSTLCFGTALYLYLYQWNISFTPPLAKVIPIIPQL